MKELKPILKTRFKCDFCPKIYVKAHRCAEHEDNCFRNPNRNCPSCENSGLVDEIMNNGWTGHKNHYCYDCETAKNLGGKCWTPDRPSPELISVKIVEEAHE